MRPHSGFEFAETQSNLQSAGGCGGGCSGPAGRQFPADGHDSGERGNASHTGQARLAGVSRQITAAFQVCRICKCCSVAMAGAELLQQEVQLPHRCMIWGNFGSTGHWQSGRF